MTLKRDLVENEYYHVYNRGAHKNVIFKEHSDYVRFLFYILYLQSPSIQLRPTRAIRKNALSEGFEVKEEKVDQLLKERQVDLTAFCLMPNHYHLLVSGVSKTGVSEYLQRVSVAYTMYFNRKYGTSGHVFQGRYQTVHVKDDDQLMHLSAYIHRNPREIKAWRGKEEHYPYSSLQDYIDKNRWGNLISTDIIAGRFENTTKSNYRDFVRTSPAKGLKQP